MFSKIDANFMFLDKSSGFAGVQDRVNRLGGGNRAFRPSAWGICPSPADRRPH